MSTVCYWKWPIEIDDLPINSMVIFHSYGTVYQRVTVGDKRIGLDFFSFLRWFWSICGWRISECLVDELRGLLQNHDLLYQNGTHRSSWVDTIHPAYFMGFQWVPRSPTSWMAIIRGYPDIHHFPNWNGHIIWGIHRRMGLEHHFPNSAINRVIFHLETHLSWWRNIWIIWYPGNMVKNGETCDLAFL